MRILAAFACVFAIHISNAAAQTLAPPLQPMIAHYTRLTQAYAENDAAMILAYRTPDFFVETPSGDRIDSSHASQILVDFLAQNQPPIEMRTDILCASMASEREAILTVSQRLGRTAQIEGQNRRVETAMIQAETWRLTSDGWRLASVTNMREPRRWLDGVETNPSTPLEAQPRPYNFRPSTQPACPAPEPGPGPGLE